MNELATYQHESARRGETSQPTEQSARRACIAQMLKSLHAGFNLPLPDPNEFNEKINAFGQTLQDVPLDEIPPLTEMLIRDMPSGFMPTAGQVYGFWQRSTGRAPMNAANVSAYSEYKPKSTDRVFGENRGELGAQAQRLNSKRFGAGLLAVTCDCVQFTAKDGYRYFKTAVLSSDGAQWVCANNACSFCAAVTNTMDAPSKGETGPLMDALTVELPAPPPPRESNNELLAALDERANIVVESLVQNAALSFARHLRGICHSSEWTPRLAAEEWSLWAPRYGDVIFIDEAVAA